MKTRVILTVFILLVFFGCGKGKFQTVPQLKFKSKNTDVVPVNGTLKVVFEFTDKEGDVHDSLWIKKTRLNQRAVATIRDSLVYKIPGYPDKTTGEIEVDLDYQSILSALTPLNSIPATNPPTKESDTLNVKFAIRDSEKHMSDSVSIGTIVVRRSL